MEKKNSVYYYTMYLCAKYVPVEYDVCDQLDRAFLEDACHNLLTFEVTLCKPIHYKSFNEALEDYDSRFKNYYYEITDYWLNDDYDEDNSLCDECESYGCYTCPHCDDYFDSEF